jgi:hypothetical protein
MRQSIAEGQPRSHRPWKKVRRIRWKVKPIPRRGPPWDLWRVQGRRAHAERVIHDARPSTRVNVAGMAAMASRRLAAPRECIWGRVPSGPLGNAGCLILLAVLLVLVCTSDFILLQILVIVEGVYSMEGETCNLPAIVQVQHTGIIHQVFIALLSRLVCCLLHLGFWKYPLPIILNPAGWENGGQAKRVSE